MLRVRPVSLLLAASAFTSWTASAGPVGTILSGSTSADEMAPYWNAAAMTLKPGTRILLHASVGATSVWYQRATPNPLTGEQYPEAKFTLAAPDWNLGAVTDFGLKDWRFGISVGIPWADGAGWNLTYEGKPASTRYHGLRPRIAQMLIGPAVAYRINRYISLGVGVDISLVLLQHDYLVDFAARINQTICKQAEATSCPVNAPLVRENPIYAGQVKINALGWSAGVFGGLLLTPTPWLRLGFGIHSNSGDVTAPGTINVEVPPAVVEFTERTLPGVLPTKLRAKGDLIYGTPMIITAGVGLSLLNDELDLGLELHWMQTSVTAIAYGAIQQTNSALIDDVTAVRGRTDQARVALRGSYALLDDLRTGLRIELINSTRPEAFMTPTTVDVWRVELSLGVIWQLVSWMDLVVEYSHFFTWDSTVRVSRFGPKALPLTAEEKGLDLTDPTGVYRVAGDRGSLGFRFHF